MSLSLKINKPFSHPKFGKLSVGSIVTIDCDKYKQPIDRFWRARLKDSAIDNCVEIITEKKGKK